jgi:RNA polymerase sigma-70 factor (ECF subfamily)
MMDDQDLVERCLKKNRAAQSLLYERYSSKMLGICYRYTKSMADAEDILQEGFIKVFRNLEQFKGSGELGAWIRRIMVNTAINFLKQKERYQVDLSFVDKGLHPVTTEENPEIRLNTRELAELIRQLPVGYQTIFNLHAVEGYSHVEIGRILGINEGTSRSQYSRARSLLISWIQKNELENNTGIYVRK